MEAPLLTRITEQRDSLSRAFRLVADVLLADPERFMAGSVQEIAAAAGVSQPSVVRFCRHYGFSGVPDFRIALAMSLVAQNATRIRPFLEPSMADKANVNTDKKRAIAETALQLIATDRAIILDSGSTLQLFAGHLREAAPLTILTAGLNIVETLWGCRQHSVIMPGGVVRFDAHALTGRMLEQSLANMRFDTIYLGADNFDAEDGLSTFNEDEAHQGAAMVGVAKRIVVLVDSSKFHATSLHRFCAIDRIDTVVTDWAVPDEVVSTLRGHGVTVIIAPDPARKV